MINIFLNENTFQYKSRLAPDTRNIYGRMNIYLNTVLDYFHTSNYFVKNSNLLVKILRILDINYHWTEVDIITHIRNNVRAVTRPLGVSIDHYVEALPRVNSIINNADEMVYVNNITNYSNYKTINRVNWKDEEPLVVRNHSFRDLYFNHPDRIDEPYAGIVVYDLDLVKLGLMYKYYAEEQERLGSHIIINEFIGRYALANTIKSIADVAILNNYLDKGNIYCRPKQFIPTTTVSITYTKLEFNVIRKSIIYQDNKSVMELVRNIPLLTRRDAYEQLFLRNFYETSRGRLYLALTLLDFISRFLVYLDVNERDNGAYYKLLRYDVNVMSNMNIGINNQTMKKKIADTLSKLKDV